MAPRRARDPWRDRQRPRKTFLWSGATRRQGACRSCAAQCCGAQVGQQGVVVTREVVLLAEHASSGEDAGVRGFFEQAPELGIRQMDAVENLELATKVGCEAGAIADVSAPGVLEATELLDQGRLDVLLSNSKSLGLGGSQIRGSRRTSNVCAISVGMQAV